MHARCKYDRDVEHDERGCQCQPPAAPPVQAFRARAAETAAAPAPLRRPDVTTPRTSDRRLARPPQVSGVTPDQLNAWRAAARAKGISLASWIRAACDAAIEREKR